MFYFCSKPFNRICRRLAGIGNRLGSISSETICDQLTSDNLKPQILCVLFHQKFTDHYPVLFKFNICSFSGGNSFNERSSLFSKLVILEKRKEKNVE